MKVKTDFGCYFCSSHVSSARLLLSPHPLNSYFSGLYHKVCSGGGRVIFLVAV